jgi:hypothetical protein
VTTLVAVNPAAWTSPVAWLDIMPTTFGTKIVAVAAGGVPPTTWQGDSGVGVAVSPMPGSTGAAEPAVQIDPMTELAPDLVVVHLDNVGGAKFTAPPFSAYDAMRNGFAPSCSSFPPPMFQVSVFNSMARNIAIYDLRI